MEIYVLSISKASCHVHGMVEGIALRIITHLDTCASTAIMIDKTPTDTELDVVTRNETGDAIV